MTRLYFHCTGPGEILIDRSGFERSRRSNDGLP
jgi:hypothetical protein